jgi:hypothetical protein
LLTLPTGGVIARTRSGVTRPTKEGDHHEAHPHTSLAVIAGLSLAGCGGSTQQTTPHQAPAQSQSPPNDAVIAQAAKAKDNQAQLGAGAIRAILVRKLGLDSSNDFNLSHHFSPGEIGSDCYVKLGADAVNFENRSENILRSPTNGADVVFVQSSTSTPLVKCLVAVRSALGW